jgi:hypothetical protein
MGLPNYFSDPSLLTSPPMYPSIPSLPPHVPMISSTHFLLPILNFDHASLINVFNRTINPFIPVPFLPLTLYIVIFSTKSQLKYKSPVAFSLITQLKLIHLFNLKNKSNYVAKFPNDFVCFF